MADREPQSSLQGRRILVVEDWLVVAQEIETLLTDLGCTVVGTVPRLAEALRFARDESLDAAVLDVNLNDEEVYPVADELLLRGIPFVFMTGYDAQALPAEFRDWPRLEKPFSADEFSRALQKAFSVTPPRDRVDGLSV